MTSTHSQQSEPLTDERREITRIMANLCRADPALFAATVRRCDALQREGMDRWEAHVYCLRELGLAPE